MNKIYCKNFFLFFFILDYLKNLKLKTKLSIQKKKVNSYSFLRAPNKYKKAQVKIVNIKYKINFTLKSEYSINFKNQFYLDHLIYFLNFYFNSYFFFESTFFFLEKKSLELKLDSKLINTLFLEL